jgi:formate dehydrogenase subunit beta
MTKSFEIEGDVAEGLRKLLSDMLESDLVAGVFALRRLDPGGAVGYSLTADPAKVADLLPFHPLMPAQGGRVLGRLTGTEALAEPVAALLRPCELRAFVELVKRHKGNLENLLLISCTCPGVYPLSASLDGGLGSKLEAYRSAAAGNQVPEDLRPACTACVEFVPRGADMTVRLVGGGKTEVLLETPRAEEVAAKLDRQTREASGDSAATEALSALRSANREKLFGEDAAAHGGLEGLVRMFGRCIGCRGCREVCPVCYCDLCEFASRRSDLKPEWLRADLDRRGGLRLPTGTLTFHLGRLTHMAGSCVACGQCSDVCPADIPVSTLFSRVGASVQGIFEYLPGGDADEPLPLTVFNTEELTEVED